MLDFKPRKYELTQESQRVMNFKSAMHARCVISPMNAPEGSARQEATTTTAAVSYAKAGNVTTKDVIPRATTRRAPKSSGRILKAIVTGGTPKSAAQGRALKTSRREAHYSPVICTAHVLTIPTRSVA
jgi:hypothetical protein